MGLGLGIFLLVLGAVFTFTGLDTSLLGTNLNTVGWILMGGGALALILGVIMNGQRANTSHTARVERHDVVDRHDVIDRTDRV